MRYLRTTLLLAGTLLLATGIRAQSTRVRGTVKDAGTGEPLPFVSVFLPGTTTGITTDDDGIFALETRDTAAVSVCAEYIGYESQTRPLRRHAFNQVDFELQPTAFGIDNVVVTPGDNPALPILEEVRRHRDQNDPSRKERCIYRTYTKMELDLAHIKPRFRNKRLQRNFGFIFEHMDTSAVTGAAYLPVLISEASADYYHQRRPAVDREVIRASRISGVNDNLAVAQFTGHLHSDVNLYENYVDLFNVRFASPLSASGTAFYKYYLVDSVGIDGRKTYKIRFHPRGLSTPVFDGEILIDSATYALQSARVRMAKGVNVNWIRHLSIENDNTRLESGAWFRKRDKVTAEFSVAMADSSKIASFIGSREIAYSDIRFDEPIPAEVLRMDNNVVLGDGADNTDEAFWEQQRPYALTEKERAIYTMVDSIQKVPLYRNIYTVINTMIGGHYNTKYIGIGPHYKLAAFNRLEGLRLRLGGRTTTAVSRKVRISGYAAYGFRDQQVKGGVGVEAMFRRTLTRKLDIRYMHDVVQLGAGNNALTEGNILGSVLSRGDQRLSMTDRADAIYEHEWRHGISNIAGVTVRQVRPNRYVPMLRPDGVQARGVNDFALQFGGRFSWNENILRLPFDKQFMGSDYPILSFGITAGVKGILPDSYDYCRIEAGIRYKLRLPPVGYSDIQLSGGTILGQVPYPLLKLHEGNGTYFYDRQAFSCMNFYEFASDRWVSLFYEHHFNGFLLGKLPLVRKLKWREVLVVKGVYGTLSERNDGSRADTRALLLFPEGMTSVSDPYVEMGFGVENIFRLLRVDCIWRMTHRDPRPGQEIHRFAVNFSVRLNF